MKKRLSLLMVLMMIVSLLPMSAFAADFVVGATQSYNVGTKFPKSVTLELDKGVGLGDYTGAGAVVDFMLDNAEFDSSTGNVSIAVLKNGVATAITADTTGGAVTIVGDNSFTWRPSAPITAVASDKLTIEIAMTDIKAVDEGDITLAVKDVDGKANIGDFAAKVIARGKSASAADLAISVTDAEKVISFTGGVLSRFEVNNFANITDADAPAGVSTSGHQMVVSVDDEDMSLTNATLVYVDGIALSVDATVDTIAKAQDGAQLGTGEFAVIGGKVYINVTDVTTTTKSIVVVPDVSVERNASEGSVKILVEAIGFGTTKNKSARATIGKVADYSVTMTVVEQNKKEIPSLWGGEETTVTVTLKGQKGALLNNRVDFTVEGADVLWTNNGSTGSGIVKPSGFTVPTISGKQDGTVMKDGEFSLSTLDTNTTEVKFNLDIKTDSDKDGVATITAAQRGWEVTSDLVKVTPKFTTKSEVTPIKKGEAKNTADVVVTEAKAGLLERNDKIQLAFSTKRDYVEFTTKSIKVEATNGMTFGDIVWGKGTVGTSWNGTEWVNKSGDVKYIVEIPVKKESSGEPAVITISGLNVAVDGSITDDVVKIDSKLNSESVSKIDYIKVVKEYDMESILSVFTIGQTAYTVNGETKAAHSAPYIKEGRTMLPIRAVAESLGLTVQWNSATRTASFTDANKVAAVTIGSKVMYVNGTPMPLTVPAELVNDTTFVELRSLATAFGVQIDWDAAAKTATVSK